MTNKMQSKQIAWRVFLNGKEITQVYYDATCDAEYVKQTLVNHDGFNPGIVVQRRG